MISLTLALGLKALREAGGGITAAMPAEHILMAGAIVATMPILVMFVLGQRYFVKGIEMQVFK